MIDYDYNEHAGRFMEESKRLRQEYDRNRERRILWLGKFAFPKVDTKKTKLLYVPADYHRYYLPIMEPLSSVYDFRNNPPEYSELKRTEIELKKWGYEGKRWRAIIRFGYYERDDILIVSKETFVYQKRYTISDGSGWW